MIISRKDVEVEFTLQISWRDIFDLVSGQSVTVRKKKKDVLETIALSLIREMKRNDFPGEASVQGHD